ncbi:hypothetical protein B0H19DRAFT_1245360 [Mycena capillaripes]|nr:hypothetical protein B0H19DRAFT_1245360 [Mycena capillaripes]
MYMHSPSSLETDDKGFDEIDDSINTGAFNLAVWTAILLDFIYDPSATPKETAEWRGIVACICNGWHRRLYSTPILWSAITIVKDIPLSTLHFAVSRCDGAMHVKLKLLNVLTLAGRPALPADVVDWVDIVFGIIGPTSHRWSSFELDTDHPVMFSRVHFHCAQLVACSLTSLRLSYTHLPRRWPGVNAEVASGPHVAGAWFLQETPDVSHLSVFGVLMLWNNFDFVHRLHVLGKLRHLELMFSLRGTVDILRTMDTPALQSLHMSIDSYRNIKWFVHETAATLRQPATVALPWTPKI